MSRAAEVRGAGAETRGRRLAHRDRRRRHHVATECEQFNNFYEETKYLAEGATQKFDLAALPIPSFRDYLPRLVGFARAHPEIGSAAMA